MTTSPAAHYKIIMSPQVDEIKNEELEPFSQRLFKFIITLTLTLIFVYGVLPLITNQVPILAKMHSYLENNGIDPSRYYYTDVDQVEESELYIEQAIHE